MRRYAVVLAVALSSLLLPLAAPAVGAVSCSTPWGSLPKGQLPPRLSGTELVDVGVGRHSCFDRMVFHFNGPGTPGYSVMYVPNVYLDGSGDLLPLTGGAKLEVLLGAPAHDPSYQPTYDGRRLDRLTFGGWQTFRDAGWGGSYEGYTTVGIGVRARLPMRAFVIDDPGPGSRLVVDVAHRW